MTIDDDRGGCNSEILCSPIRNAMSSFRLKTQLEFDCRKDNEVL